MIFFFIDTSSTEIYTLSLHDALPISSQMTTSLPAATTVSSFGAATSIAVGPPASAPLGQGRVASSFGPSRSHRWTRNRSEEHTSELQSRRDLVCRLLLEKKKKQTAKN